MIQTPEVSRVYIGSFWDGPLQNDETAPLLEAEMADLLTDLNSLPSSAAVRKVSPAARRRDAARRGATTPALAVSLSRCLAVSLLLVRVARDARPSRHPAPSRCLLLLSRELSDGEPAVFFIRHARAAAAAAAAAAQVNELVKRMRLLKAHAHLMDHLRGEVGRCAPRRRED